MSNEYMDLVIMTNGNVCLAPGFSNIQPGWKVVVQGCMYEVLGVVSVFEDKTLLTLPKAYGVIRPLEYNEDKQEENADV